MSDGLVIERAEDGQASFGARFESRIAPADGADRRSKFELKTALIEAQAKTDNLNAALKHSRVIGQAIGIVMDRRRIPETEAFAYLRDLSNLRNVKVHDLAQWIVESGELPELEL